jgi:hydroxymethylglutaryl-CoA reductase
VDPSIAEALKEGLIDEKANQFVENAVGTIGIPLGIATHFIVNGNDLLVPMAVEEPSVIAAACNAARMARFGGGFVADADESLMAAQIEILDPARDAKERLLGAAPKLISMADASQPGLVAVGGGCRTIEVRVSAGAPKRLVVHLIVDCKDAMGANSVNTMAEAVSDEVRSLSGGRIGLRILTNLADKRLARAKVAIPFEGMKRGRFDGETVSKGVVAAWEFAAADPYRAATHNKGIFNGVDAVLVATGNDWRAVEAGGHAFAAVRTGSYSPLSWWRIEDDRLVGELEMPMALGIVGGAARAHPTAAACIALMGIKTARELASIVASVGLASNLAALAALAAEGIQLGHMRLHGRKQSST